jgi:hypothetical protein
MTPAEAGAAGVGVIAGIAVTVAGSGAAATVSRGGVEAFVGETTGV